MSNLTAVQIAFLQRLHADTPATTPITQVASFFHEHYSLGLLAGRNIAFSPADHEKAARLLRTYGQSTTPVPKSASRAQAHRPGISEKVGSVAPHADSLALKCAAGRCALHASSDTIGSTGYCVLSLDEALRVGADCIMVVENLETFRHLASQHWIDYQNRNVLAVFRGDNRFKADEVIRFLQTRNEPVWGFMDFDPAGLGLASQLPRLQRLILPEDASLRAMVERAERRDLFVTQRPQWGGILDAVSCGPIATAWQRMKSLQSGLPQEHMIVESMPGSTAGERHG